jgi:beta-galactosidase
MILGTQYYRPPFPDKQYWEADFRQMREAGLNTVQLWACWGWVEPSPGDYRFDDYDELMALADAVGLKVVISTIAEIHPFWIHRAVPGSAMTDHMGREVISSLRKECNVGLTPGGCTDNPEVRDHMGAFLREIAKRYRGAPALEAWDCWNETRWAVNADGYVCYCSHTLRAYRSYLAGRYGDLEGLNGAWKRRYSDWEDVRPGKLPGRPYTDLMEFQGFLTARAAAHAAFRRDMLRSEDPDHLIVAHCANPSVFSSGRDHEQAVSRGNDWDLADELDGFGSSHFPIWAHIPEADVGARIEAIRSAVRDKPMWVSELQGGASRDGIQASDPVPAAAQQKWVWSAIGRGAKAVIFWCWRDEVFGSESSGFGLAGADGSADERLIALRTGAAALERHAELFDSYLPDPARVGVLFEERNYQLDWSEYGPAAKQAKGSLTGYLEALERIGVPYEIVDSGHIESIAPLKLLIMPWPLVVAEGTAPAVEAWVEAGGALLVEPELGAYDERGFYHYPQDRELATRLGIRSLGRRNLPASPIALQVGASSFNLRAASWVEALSPSGADVLATSGGEAIAVKVEKGLGSVISVGSFIGLAYRDEPPGTLGDEARLGFEEFVRQVVLDAGAASGLSRLGTGGGDCYWRLGQAGDRDLLFVIGGDDESFQSSAGAFEPGDELVELIGGARAKVSELDGKATVALGTPHQGCAVWSWQSKRGPVRQG